MLVMPIRCQKMLVQLLGVIRRYNMITIAKRVHNLYFSGGWEPTSYTMNIFNHGDIEAWNSKFIIIAVNRIQVFSCK